MKDPHGRRRRRRRHDPVPAAQALARFRGRSGAAAGPGAEASAAALAWPEVVGAAAAAHSVPVRRSRAGVLTVACSSAAWAHELTARREELAARLAERCPEAGAVALRFSVADHAFQVAEPRAPAPRPVTPTASQRAEGERAAGEVADPRLRELVERAAAASAARRDRSPNR